MTRQHLLPLFLTLVLAGLVGGFFIWLAETEPNISDTIGYVYAGERLADGQGLTYEHAYNEWVTPHFSLYAFQIRRADDLRMFLGFPPGFPILLAGGSAVAGSKAIHFVVPLLAALTVITAFFLGRILTNSAWGGWWTAVFLALTPAFWQFGTAAWSEIPATLFISAGSVLYLMSRQAQRPLRTRLILSVIAGLLLVYSFFIRYANVTILPAIAVYELVIARRHILTERWRWPLYLLLGGGLIGILLFNQAYYGGFTTTSYSPQHGWYPLPPFSLDYALGPSFVNGYSLTESFKSLWQNFSLFILLAPSGWVLMKRPLGLFTATAAFSSLFLYAIYAFAPEGINSRFLLPIYPFITAGIAQVLVTGGKRMPNQTWRWVGGSVLLLWLFWPVPDRVNELKARNSQNHETAVAISSLTAQTPTDAVFLSYQLNDQIITYGQRAALNYRRIPLSDVAEQRYRLEMLEPCLVQAIARLHQQAIPVYYLAEGGARSWDVELFLADYFSLEPVDDTFQMRRVVGPSTAIFEELEACQLLP